MSNAEQDARCVIGVDVGGTFTDTVVITPDGGVAESKALTTRQNLVEGVLASIDSAAAKLGLTLAELLGDTLWISHGTTVGLNALLTHTGAAVGFLTTEGFESVLPIARLNYIRGIRPEDRTEMRRWEKPELLVERSRIIGVRERVDARGRVLTPLDEAQVRESVRQLKSDGVESIAVCLLWSVENPTHERRVRAIVQEELPGTYVTISSDLTSRMGEYERGVSAVLNSYVGPLFEQYLEELELRLGAAGFGGTLYGMQMDGGVQPADRIRSRALTCIKSGPVGGLFASQRIGAALGHDNVIATDVGGTSFDVGLVVAGRVPVARQPRIDRYEIATPVADVVSIGTGGGSIARVHRELGSLVVGPESAGATPGPVCYGRGGTKPTVTDAAAVLGYMTHAGRDLVLDTVAARAAIETEIAVPLGVTVEEAADGIVRVASSQMADLVRRVTILRGYDLADFALYAYGGAAPQYAGRYGVELHLDEVVVPRLASVLSAFGVAVSDLQTSQARDLVAAPLAASLDLVSRVLTELETTAAQELAAVTSGRDTDADLVRLAGLRYVRQVEEIEVPLMPGPVTAETLRQLEEDFRSEYERMVGSGTTVSDTVVEIVTLTVRLRLPLGVAGEQLTFTGVADDEFEATSRPVWFDGEWGDCPVVGINDIRGGGRAGPALVELPTTTVVVYPGQWASVDMLGNIVLHLGAGRGGLMTIVVDTDGPDAFTFEIIRHRLTAINDEAALSVTKVAGTTLVTEATDMNSALMLADGTVAVFGEYVLVHSCSLNNVVTDILEHYQRNPGIRPGDMFITNDPYVTGTHQLDAVVVAPIFDGDRLVAWSGTVVHQSDVGGPSAGSVTIGAKSIYEEAVPMAPMKIVEAGEIRNDVQREYLVRTRTPELNNLDLLAQIAANRLFGERVIELCRTYGTGAVTGTLERLVSGTERQLRERLAEFPDGVWRYNGYVDHDGIDDKLYAIRLEMTKRGDSLVLDFRDCAGQAPSMINLTRDCLLNNALTAVITLLGFDGIGWVPGAFANVVEILSTPGTIVDCVWPAGVSVGGTFAGQEARTAVNVCITRMLDASEQYAPMAMASCMCSAPGQAVSGHRGDGSFFTATLLDAQGGGAGARTFADGSDVSGPLHAPGGASANVESNEHAYPIRYLWRRERPDSGGPGRYRGGIGSTFAYAAHEATGPVTLTLFAHGVSHPTSSGVLGGEPGTQHGFLVLRDDAARAGWAAEGGAGLGDVPAAKSMDSIDGDEVIISWCSGGGGLGDPLERPAEEVLADVRHGLVTPGGAASDYGVVVARTGAGSWTLDVEGTDAARVDVRRRRLGGAEPRPAVEATGAAWFTSNLVLDTDTDADTRAATVSCRRCAQALGPAAVNVRTLLRMEIRPVERRWALAGRHPDAGRLEVRHFFCPGCGQQMDVEVGLAGEAPVWASQITTGAAGRAHDEGSAHG